MCCDWLQWTCWDWRIHKRFFLVCCSILRTNNALSQDILNAFDHPWPIEYFPCSSKFSVYPIMVVVKFFFHFCSQSFWHNQPLAFQNNSILYCQLAPNGRYTRNSGENSACVLSYPSFTIPTNACR